MHPHIHTWIYKPVCVCVWCVQEYGFFPLVLLAWLRFTLKVADHLRQMLLLNGLNEWQPGSTNKVQTLDTGGEILFNCIDTWTPPVIAEWFLTKSQ